MDTHLVAMDQRQQSVYKVYKHNYATVQACTSIDMHNAKGHDSFPEPNWVRGLLKEIVKGIDTWVKS